MAKRKWESDQLIGYLTEVSPIRTAKNNNKYFFASIQTSKTEVKRIISFSADKHEEFMKAAKSTNAVTLRNISIGPGRDGDDQVKVERNSTLEYSPELDFKKSYTYLAGQSHSSPDIPTSICDLEEYALVTVNVKCLGYLDKRKTVDTRYGQKEVGVMLVSDPTRATKLTVWGAKLLDILEKENSYTITNVKCKRSGDIIQLTTISTTEAVKIEDIEDACQDIKELMNYVTIETSVQAVNIITNKRCVACKKIIVTTTGDVFIRCNHCNKKQMASSLSVSTVTTLTITVDDQLLHLTAKEETLKNFLEQQQRTDLLENTDALEDFLLQIPTLAIEYSKDSMIVINISTH